MRPRSTSPQCPRVWYLIRKTPLWYFVGGHDRPQEEPQPGPFLPRSWTVFGGSSWGLSWRHFCVKETDESTEKIHGKSMTPRKKIHGKFMQSIFQSPDPSLDPKIHDTHGGGSEAPPKAEGEPNPYFHSRAPRGPGASGPPWAPVALSTLLPQGRCFAYSDHGRAHVDHTFYKMDQLNESAQDSCCRGRRTRCTLNLYFKFFVLVMFSLAFC